MFGFARFMAMGSFLILASTAAEAACTLGDLRGTWFVEGMGGNVAGHCRLVFDANGALITGSRGSECTYDKPENFATVTLRD